MAPVFTAVCLTFAGVVQAQDNKPATNNEVAAYSEQLSAEETAVADLFAKGLQCQAAGKYQEALSLYKQASDKIAKLYDGKPGKLKVAFEEKCAALRLSCQHEFGESTLQKCRAGYIEMISEKDLALASTKAEQLKKELQNALAVYYLGDARGTPDQLQKAINADPIFSERVNNQISECDKISGYFNFKQDTDIQSIDPGYADRQITIRQLYREGEILYRQRRFMQVRDKMEQILILDPYNQQASQMLSRVYRKLYLIADMRQYNEMLHDQAQNEWRWMENIPREHNLQPDAVPREYVDTNSPLYEKIKNLIIPSIVFTDFEVNSAIQTLRERAKEADPEHTDINIILKMGHNPSQVNTVTFNLENVPFLEAIRYLCLNAGLKYRINEKAQVIYIGTPEEIAKGETMDKIYIPIRHATVLRMIGAKSESEGKAGGDKEFTVDGASEAMSVEDTFKSGMGAATAKRAAKPKYSDELRKYFISLGFPFPDESTFIAYDTRKNRLVVQNTPENLRKLELLVREVDIETPLVLMEAKMMEISMTDLEELGFDWLLTHENTNPRWSFSIASPVPSSTYSDNTLINNMNILPNFGGDNIWNLFLTVNAIDRTDRTEVLSTPKLMSKNGMPAKIRMVRQMYFPESWSDPEVSTSCGSSISLEPSVPEFGDATDIGVIFEATPTVNPNNYTINLVLNPQVVDLVGWSDYSYELVFGTFNGNGNTSSSNNQSAKVTLKMPELSVRQIETNVKVYDGQTIVIGGMLKDTQARVDDRWPVLGDVPLLGRLFSNDSTKIIKNNLLISVTSRLISGDGAPLRTNTATGLPDFRR